MRNLIVIAVTPVLLMAPTVWAEFLEIEASQIATIVAPD